MPSNKCFGNLTFVGVTSIRATPTATSPRPLKNIPKKKKKRKKKKKEKQEKKKEEKHSGTKLISPTSTLKCFREQNVPLYISIATCTFVHQIKANLHLYSKRDFPSYKFNKKMEV